MGPPPIPFRLWTFQASSPPTSWVHRPAGTRLALSASQVQSTAHYSLFVSALIPDALNTLGRC